jgi:hypothetical protein
MKIVNLATFLSLPPNTVFSKFEPCVFDDLMIKGENCGKMDFIYSEAGSSAIENNGSADFATKLFRATDTGESLAMDFDCTGRDGCFEPNQLFAVWEEADIRALIERLKRCLQST